MTIDDSKRRDKGFDASDYRFFLREKSRESRRSFDQSDVLWSYGWRGGSGFDPDRDYEKELTRGKLRQFGIAVFEILLIFVVFAIYGAWPTPDVNEQYYVGKAIHFWNPSWLGADPFLSSPDSHWLFYATFGSLSFFFSQNVLVWVGRVLTWFLTACAWRRLSRALIPIDFVAVLTAAAFAFYLESFHLAGEWIIGGVEGKSFAFPFVFWGLACFLEGKFNRAWILLGIGSAFHPLVGGWTVLACLVAWALDAHRRYRLFLAERRKEEGDVRRSCGARVVARLGAFFVELKNTAFGLVVGGAISLLGVIPALKLDAGASAAAIRESRRIYVFERLPHHLVASSLPWTFLLRFALMTLAVAMLATLGAFLLRKMREERAPLTESRSKSLSERSADVLNDRFTRLTTFVFAAICFALIGAAFDWGRNNLVAIGIFSDPKDVAGILRYYWYRLSDWVVPFGLVFFATRLGLESVATLHARSRKTNGWNPGVCAVSTFVALLASGAGYWGFRLFFFRRAAEIARASAVDGLVPLPTSTECVAYMALVVALGTILLLWGCCAALCRPRRSSLVFDKSQSRFPAATSTCLIVWLATIVVAVPCWRLCYYVDLRGTKVVPRSAPPKESIADGWIDACRWVRDNTPEDAIFLVPRKCDSFKWHARRAEVGNWKEIPQDAKSIVEWSRKMKRFYDNPGAPEGSPMRWNQPLNVVFLNKGRARVLKESEEDGYHYAIVETPPYTIFTIPEALRRWQEFVDNNRVYENAQFVVLKLRDPPSVAAQNAPKESDDQTTSQE